MIDPTGNALACDLAAIPPAERAEHARLAELLFAERPPVSSIDGTGKNPEGYAFEFEAADVVVVAQWIACERLCCPFLRFVLEVPSARGPVRLVLAGPPGTRAFLDAELKSSRGRYREPAGASPTS